VEAIRDGDRNTSYFHISTIIRRCFNCIETLKDDNGHWITEAAEIKQSVVNYFATLFSESTSHPQNHLPSGRFPRIQEDQFAELSKPYSDEEVLLALCSMQPLKAPGPDGYHALFFSEVLALGW